MIKHSCYNLFKYIKLHSIKSLKHFVDKSTKGKGENYKSSQSSRLTKKNTNKLNTYPTSNTQSNEKFRKSEKSFDNKENFLDITNYTQNYQTDKISQEKITALHKESKKSYQHNQSNSSLEKSIDNYTIEDFFKLFVKTIPLQFDKKSIIQPDQNLTCFIPYTNIISKPKATSLAKQFLEDIVVYLNTGDEKIFEKFIYEENLVQKLKIGLEKILAFNTDPSSFIKYKIYFNSPQEKLATNFKQNQNTNKTPHFISKKFKFNINLFNIKNFICLGVEPDRKVIKNTKLLSHYENMIMDNPIEKNEMESIKTDVVTYRESSKLFLKEFDSVPLCLLSQYQYNFLPLDEKNKIILYLEVKDELNEKEKKFELNLNQIDFVIECVIFHMTYGDILKMEDEKKNEIVDKRMTDVDGNKENNEDNKFEMEESQEVKNVDINKDIYSMWKYMNREKISVSNSKFKIIDVNNFMDGNKLI